jgi:hypothetical protein
MRNMVKRWVGEGVLFNMLVDSHGSSESVTTWIHKGERRGNGKKIRGLMANGEEKWALAVARS